MGKREQAVAVFPFHTHVVDGWTHPPTFPQWPTAYVNTRRQARRPLITSIHGGGTNGNQPRPQLVAVAVAEVIVVAAVAVAIVVAVAVAVAAVVRDTPPRGNARCIDRGAGVLLHVPVLPLLTFQITHPLMW